MFGVWSLGFRLVSQKPVTKDLLKEALCKDRSSSRNRQDYVAWVENPRRVVYVEWRKAASTQMESVGFQG